MTIKIYLFILLFGYKNLAAQNTGVISYKYVRKGFNGPVFYKMYFDAEKSIYVANRGKRRRIVKVGDESFKMDTIGATDKEFEAAFYAHKPLWEYCFDEEGEVVYKDFKNNTLDIRQVNGKHPVLIKEKKVNTLNWTLVDSTKKIGKFTCQKAMVIFRGRAYEAWYTLEIPVSNGPWKLHGLPGLILEANSKDKDHTFSYTFLGLEIPLQDTSIIKPPITGEQMEISRYSEVLYKRDVEENRKLNSESQSRGSDVTVTTIRVPEQELNYDDLK